MTQVNSQESAQPGMLPEDVPAPDLAADIGRPSARNWYWWLWFSPLLTIPTLVFFLTQDIGMDMNNDSPTDISRSCEESMPAGSSPRPHLFDG